MNVSPKLQAFQDWLGAAILPTLVSYTNPLAVNGSMSSIDDMFGSADPFAVTSQPASGSFGDANPLAVSGNQPDVFGAGVDPFKVSS